MRRITAAAPAGAAAHFSAPQKIPSRRLQQSALRAARSRASSSLSRRNNNNSTSTSTWPSSTFRPLPPPSPPRTRREFSSLPAPSANDSPPPRNNNGSNLPQTQDDDPHGHLEPIDFATASQISGEESQILEVRLRPNEMLRAESGAMLYMTEGVEMETSMGLGGAGGNGGGFSAGLTRMMTGQNLMVSDFRFAPPTAESSSQSNVEKLAYGTVGLGTDFPAKILKFALADHPDARLICQKGAFLAGSHGVLMEMSYAKSFAGGFFGGEGFVLQSLRGNDAEDTVFLKAYGTVVKKELRPGETLRVSSGSLVAMTSAIDYDVQTMPGFKNVMFGGEGLFVTTLTGPGTVWLQGMPVDRMVSEIARKVPSGGGIGLGVPMMVGGGGGEADAGAGDSADVGGAVGDADGSGEDAVAAADAAAEADRNATVASSGMASPPSDPESSESLFGDAAYGGEGSSAMPGSEGPGGGDGTSFSTEDFSQPANDIPEFEEPTILDEPFEDDGTTFSTYEGDESSPGGGEADIPTPDEEGPSILSQLWDFFTDDD